MLQWSIDAFRAYDPECGVVLVVHPDYLEKWKELLKGEGITAVAGGESRIESVRNGLKEIGKEGKNKNGEERIVFIHDAARPGVSPELIRRGEEKVGPGVGAVPVIALSDSIRRLEGDGSVAVNRADYVAVQTPQVFIFEDIMRAYEGLPEDTAGFTDDASVAEAAGIPIVTFQGDSDNMKVTNPGDIERVPTPPSK